MDRRTVDLFTMFSDELNLVKKEFSQREIPLHLSLPFYAGRATWARSLKRRIDIPMKVRLFRYLSFIFCTNSYFNIQTMLTE